MKEKPHARQQLVASNHQAPGSMVVVRPPKRTQYKGTQYMSISGIDALFGVFPFRKGKTLPLPFFLLEKGTIFNCVTIVERQFTIEKDQFFVALCFTPIMFEIHLSLNLYIVNCKL